VISELLLIDGTDMPAPTMKKNGDRVALSQLRRMFLIAWSIRTRSDMVPSY
jgi:hypothetical protein